MFRSEIFGMSNYNGENVLCVITVQLPIAGK